MGSSINNTRASTDTKHMQSHYTTRSKVRGHKHNTHHHLTLNHHHYSKTLFKECFLRDVGCRDFVPIQPQEHYWVLRLKAAAFIRSELFQVPMRK